MLKKKDENHRRYSERTLREAMKFSKAKTKREAILAALEVFNRQRRMAGLVKHSGTFTSMMSNDEIEGLEMECAKRSDEPATRRRKHDAD